jgi:hypothetical protein
LNANPRLAEAHNNMGVTLRNLRRPEEARIACLRALELKSDTAEAHSNLGNVLQDLGRTEDAITAYGVAIELKPDYAGAYINLAIAQQALGRTPEVRSALDHAFALDPGSSHAWHIRSDLKRFSPNDPDIERMEVALANLSGASADVQSLTRLHFALGKAWMDAEDSDRAFAHLHAGNRLKRASFAYDLSIDLGRFASIEDTYTPQWMQRLAGGGDPSELPVFVVGMPRSGTTLVEQILASHPDVHGAGELSLLVDLIDGAMTRDGARLGYPTAVSRLRPDGLAALGRSYVGAAASLAPDRWRVVDKTPSNFKHVGLIHLIAPNARIIHCRRDPVDTCLSCYSKLFTGEQNFVYDLTELGRYYCGYARLMDHWRGLLPADRFIEIHYEDLVANLEGEARRLLAGLGLDWNESCLAFHKTDREVRTASVNQVRQPIYRDAVGRWKPVAPHLAPLLAALEDGIGLKIRVSQPAADLSVSRG